MEFKIDTKDTFSTITPVAAQINANLTGALREKCGEIGQSGSNNFIVDLHHCASIDPDTIDELLSLHEEIYGSDHSLVFTGICGDVLAALRAVEADLVLNVAPRMQEAIDIISMEILERDLLGEED